MDGLVAVRYCVHNSRVNCTGPVWPFADRCDGRATTAPSAAATLGLYVPAAYSFDGNPSVGNGDDGFGIWWR